MKITKIVHNTFIYENSSDFEVIPKIALNDANLIVKLKSSNNLIKKVGLVEHFHVSITLSCLIIFYCSLMLTLTIVTKNIR
jgi:hypothetical protein